MSVTLEILDTFGEDSPSMTFTANGTAVCLGGESVNVTVVLVPPDFSSVPAVQPAVVTPVSGAPCFNEWTVTFEGGIPDVPFAIYALAYNVSTGGLVGSVDEIISVIDSAVKRLHLKKKTKKKTKKVNKKTK